MAGDPSLNDEQLEAEIRLVGDLVLAASQSETPLSQDEVDAVLGLPPEAEGAEGEPPEGERPARSAPRPGAA